MNCAEALPMRNNLASSRSSSTGQRTGSRRVSGETSTRGSRRVRARFPGTPGTGIPGGQTDWRRVPRRTAARRRRWRLPALAVDEHVNRAAATLRTTNAPPSLSGRCRRCRCRSCCVERLPGSTRSHVPRGADARHPAVRHPLDHRRSSPLYWCSNHPSSRGCGRCIGLISPRWDEVCTLYLSVRKSREQCRGV